MSDIQARSSALSPDRPPVQAGRYKFSGPNEARTVGLAREWVADLLETLGRPRLAEAARLCTSEAVTNAHIHTGSAVLAVEVVVTDGRVFVFVRDDAVDTTLPPPGELSHAPAFQEGGRGLHLIAAFAERWDVMPGRGRDKVVWFSLAEGPAEGAREGARGGAAEGAREGAAGEAREEAREGAAEGPEGLG
ncbi:MULTISPECIES: ATP-binding protein [unclassified Streptomyces]|uniref:ATP-binding protein n=1 Tax=unclassified Streptomyces TaxID=2593676 RepID=UPI0036525735